MFWVLHQQVKQRFVYPFTHSSDSSNAYPTDHHYIDFSLLSICPLPFFFPCMHSFTPSFIQWTQMRHQWSRTTIAQYCDWLDRHDQETSIAHHLRHWMARLMLTWCRAFETFKCKRSSCGKDSKFGKNTKNATSERDNANREPRSMAIMVVIMTVLAGVSRAGDDDDGDDDNGNADDDDISMIMTRTMLIMISWWWWRQLCWRWRW